MAAPGSAGACQVLSTRDDCEAAPQSPDARCYWAGLACFSGPVCDPSNCQAHPACMSCDALPTLCYPNIIPCPQRCEVFASQQVCSGWGSQRNVSHCNWENNACKTVMVSQLAAVAPPPAPSSPPTAAAIPSTPTPTPTNGTGAVSSPSQVGPQTSSPPTVPIVLGVVAAVAIVGLAVMLRVTGVWKRKGKSAKALNEKPGSDGSSPVAKSPQLTIPDRFSLMFPQLEAQPAPNAAVEPVPPLANLPDAKPLPTRPPVQPVEPAVRSHVEEVELLAVASAAEYSSKPRPVSEAPSVVLPRLVADQHSLHQLLERQDSEIGPVPSIPSTPNETQALLPGTPSPEPATEAHLTPASLERPLPQQPESSSSQSARNSLTSPPSDEAINEQVTRRDFVLPNTSRLTYASFPETEYTDPDRRTYYDSEFGTLARNRMSEYRDMPGTPASDFSSFDRRRDSQLTQQSVPPLLDESSVPQQPQHRNAESVYISNLMSHLFPHERLAASPSRSSLRQAVAHDSDDSFDNDAAPPAQEAALDGPPDTADHVHQ
ncbi:hypothetical protein RI367_007395 [Sorochytrium milnesiophthora]